MKHSGLKIRILIPLMMAITILLGAFAASFYRFQQVHVFEDVVNKLKSMEDLFKVQLDSDAHMMGAALEVIRRDEEIRDALKVRDRETLLELTRPLFMRFQSQHRITHFYFTGPDRVNILRVHMPDRHGDRIERFTTLAAEASRSLSSGIELGPLGTFTLRVVAPCYDGETLAGYVELGEEIDHITQKLHEILGVEIYVLIDKQYLDRETWGNGMRMLGREIRWDLFPSVVVVDQTDMVIPEALARLFSEEKFSFSISDPAISHNERRLQTKFISLQDAGDRRVGTMVVVRDITDLTGDLRGALFLIAGVCLGVGGILFVIFYIFLGRVESKMEAADLELLRISTAVQSASDAILLTDMDGKPIYQNRAFTELLGYGMNELTSAGGPTALYVDPHVAHHALETIKEGGSWNGEVEMQSRGGRRIHVLARGDSIRNEAGEILGLMTTYTDITQRKQAQEALRESEERFRTMAATAKDAIIILDNEERIAYWNPAAEAIFGYTNQEAMGKELHEWLAPERYHEVYRKGFSRFKKTGEGDAVGKTLELEAIRNDGSEFPIGLSMSAIQLKGKWNAVGIVRDITKRKRMEEELRRLSYLDGLTGVANRRHFDEVLHQEWKRMRRDRKPLSLIMCDIDYFKAYNDTCGHQSGDDGLRQVAQTLNSLLKRPGDLVARYGGEEFAVVLPATDAKGAAMLAERMRKEVESLGIAHPGSQVCEIMTISFGVSSTVPDPSSSPAELISASDQALYQAKKEGRNRVILT